MPYETKFRLDVQNVHCRKRFMWGVDVKTDDWQNENIVDYQWQV